MTNQTNTQRITVPTEAADDQVLDYTLRPRTLLEFVGQKEIKENLEILMGAARQRQESIEHVLLYGNPGLGKCVTADTLVFSEYGMVPIGSLGNLEKQGPQEKTIELYGFDAAHSTSHFYNNGVSKTIEIRTHHGYELAGTLNHPIVVLEQDGRKFKQLDELKKGDIVAIGRGQQYFGSITPLPTRSFEVLREESTATREYKMYAAPELAASVPRQQLEHLYLEEGKSASAIATQLQCSPSTVFNTLQYYGIPRRAAWEHAYQGLTLPQEMTPELARLCGYLIGDAYVGKMGEIAFSNEDQEVLHDYCRIWQLLFNQEVYISKWKTKCSVVRAKNQRIREFFIHIGIPYCTSHNKVIPWSILRAPKAMVAEFLRGYFECDGHIRPNCRQIDIISASKELIKQLQIILLNFGIISRRYTDTNKKEGRTYERLYITGGDVDIFNKEIGFISSRKQQGKNFPIKKNTNKDLVPFGKEYIRGLKKTLVELTKHLITQHMDRTGKQQISNEAMNRCLDRIKTTCTDIVQQTERLRGLCTPYLFWDRIESLIPGYAQTVDVSIPNTHTFFGNGFINHNTTLAHVIAHEMGTAIRTTSGPTIERVGDLAAILTNLQPGDALFIDEIHRLNKSVEEVLYSAMEEYALDLVVGKGPAARTLRLDLPRFTLIGATTRMSLLSSPLRDRFGATYHLNFYTQEDIEKILARSARLLSVRADTEALSEIAKRSRRTPRVANRLLRRVRDFAQVRGVAPTPPNLPSGRGGNETISPPLGGGVRGGVSQITSALALEALGYLNVDPHGLDEVDRRLLQAIIEKFSGGPVGLNALAAATAEEEATIEEIYEPYLLQLGFLDRTPRGRVATTRAYEHLGVKKAGTIL